MTELNKRNYDLDNCLDQINIYKKLWLKFVWIILDSNYNYLIDEDLKNNELYLDFDNFSEKDFIDDENLVNIINFWWKLWYIIKIDWKEVIFVKLKNNIQKKDIWESILDILANYWLTK